MEQEEEKLIQLINDYRAENGLPRLHKNETVMRAARVRAEEITTKFSHTRPNGEYLRYLDEFGAKNLFAGYENIYQGYFSAERAFNAWKRSPGHNGTMLFRDSDVTEIGVGITARGYAVMLLGEYV